MVRRSAGVEELSAQGIGNIVATDTEGWVDQVHAIAAGAPIIAGVDSVGGSASGEVLSLLAAASREHGQSIAMVTHDPVAASYADRVLFLGDGRIVADKPRQTAEQISAHMLSTEVAA